MAPTWRGRHFLLPESPVTVVIATAVTCQQGHVDVVSPTNVLFGALIAGNRRRGAVAKSPPIRGSAD
jgi:hypothetical protein